MASRFPPSARVPPLHVMGSKVQPASGPPGSCRDCRATTENAVVDYGCQRTLPGYVHDGARCSHARAATAHAVALRLRDAGADETSIGQALAIPVEAVPSLLRIAESKLEALMAVET